MNALRDDFGSDVEAMERLGGFGPSTSASADPWGVYASSQSVDVLSFNHGVAAFVVHGDPVPRALWLNARLVWWRSGDSLFLAFKRYDGPMGAPRFIMLAEAPRALSRCIAALKAHEVIDVLVVDRNADKDSGSPDDIVLFGAVPI
jgi:hypothetical protein